MYKYSCEIIDKFVSVEKFRLILFHMFYVFLCLKILLHTLCSFIKQ